MYSHDSHQRRWDVIIKLSKQSTYQWTNYSSKLLHALEQAKQSAEPISLCKL